MILRSIFSLLILIFSISISSIWSQDYDLGIQIGASGYFGDLDAPEFSKNINNSNIAGAVFLRYHLNHYLSAKGSIMLGKLEANDSQSSLEWQRRRNLSFKSNLQELSILGEFRPINFFSNSIKTFSPYFSAGLALFHFNPKTFYEGQWVELQPLGTEGQGMSQFSDRKPYHRTQISIPFGGGFDIRLSDELSIGMEILSRKTFTDYIDDISTEYVNYYELQAGNGDLAAALGNRTGEFLGQSEPFILETGTPRGEASVKDYYYTAMITITYHLKGSLFGKKVGEGCPTF